MAIYLNRFHIVKPRYRLRQEQLLAWISRCHQLSESFKPTASQMSADTIEKLFQRYGVKPAQISERYFECNDAAVETVEERDIFRVTEQNLNGVDIGARTEFFSRRAYQVFQDFYPIPSPTEMPVPRPDHLIHVTCTGYISPSAAQRIVVRDDWEKQTAITHAYHMGCYASLPAVRLAQSLVSLEAEAQPDYTVDIAHTEMCGLHMSPAQQTPEQMVVQTLFADGHAKYSASRKPRAHRQNLKVLAVLEKVLPNSSQDMSWLPTASSMQMTLSREVPPKIKLELKEFSKALFAKAGIEEAIAMKSIFAVHPGGPKIIDAVQETLGLSESQIIESRKILFERGNMSSATLPHVWNEILENGYQSGMLVVSYAFGPGLTLFGAVFEIC